MIGTAIHRTAIYHVVMSSRRSTTNFQRWQNYLCTSYSEDYKIRGFIRFRASRNIPLDVNRNSIRRLIITYISAAHKLKEQNESCRIVPSFCFVPLVITITGNDRNEKLVIIRHSTSRIYRIFLKYCSMFYKLILEAILWEGINIFSSARLKDVLTIFFNTIKHQEKPAEI